MDGRCFGCATKFGFFTKEHGCHKCGHAFCKACLPSKIVIPGPGSGSSTKPQAVCSSCYQMLQKPQTEGQLDNIENEGRYSPPENFKKRVAALHQQQQATQAHSPKSAKVKGQATQPVSSSAKYKKLAPKDRDIAMRLDKLQEERKKTKKTPLTESEIEERLQRLRGVTPSEPSQPAVYQPPTNKTSQEEMDDLLEQMTDEAALDARLAGNKMPEQSLSEQHVPSASGPQCGLGGDPLIPSEEELRQLVDDAKRLLGAQRQTQEGSNGTIGNGTRNESSNDEAKRLVEEASRLMEAARSEVARDEECSKRDAAMYAEIAGRLAQLQGRQCVGNVAATGDVQDSDDEDDEEAASRRLIQQLLEESKLEEKVAADGYEVQSKKSQPGKLSSAEGGGGGCESKPQQTPHMEGASNDPSELPWCCICNEDATLRCLGCDGDLYCRRCLREEHKEFGEEGHRCEPYKAPVK